MIFKLSVGESVNGCLSLCVIVRFVTCAGCTYISLYGSWERLQCRCDPDKDRKKRMDERIQTAFCQTNILSIHPLLPFRVTGGLEVISTVIV